MSQKSDSPGVRKRFSFGKFILIALVGLVVLLGAVYFVATSSGFITGFILPRAGKAINATITADSIALKPFSSATVKNLRVVTTGAEPLVVAPEAIVRYKLREILKGNIVVDEVTLSSPQVNIITAADGTSNLDPLLKGEEKPETKEPAPNLDIHNVSLRNAAIKLAATAKDGSVQTTELSALNLTLDQLKNGQAGKLNIDSNIRLAGAPPPGQPGTNDALQTTLKGAFTFTITQDLLPQNLQGEATFAVGQTAGTYNDLAGLSGKLQANLTPTQIENLRLQFERSQAQLGSVVVSGPFNPEQLAGTLRVQIQSVDRNVLNLVGGMFGIDFADTMLNSTNSVEIAAGASAVTVAGNLTGQKFTLRQDGKTTPSLDINLNYEVQANLTNQTAIVRRVDLSARQNQSDLIRASIEQPLGVSWGTAMAGVPDSTLRLALTNFNLADWTSITGTNIPSGRLGLLMNLRSESGGQRININVAGRIADLSTAVGTNQIRQGLLTFGADGTLAGMTNANFTRFSFDLSEQNRLIAKGAGSGTMNLGTGDMDTQLQLESSLPELLRLSPVDGLSARRGAVTVKTTASIKGGRTAANGELQVASLDANYDVYAFQNFAITAPYNIEMSNNVAQIQNLSLKLSENGAAGGQVDLSGRLNLTNNAAQITFKTTGLNQTGLRPFLAPSLGDKKLITAALDADGTAASDPSGQSSIKGTIKLENLVVNDPSGTVPAKPLGGEVEIDAAVNGDVTTLNQFVLMLSPTARAKNQLQIQGKLDFRTNNPAPSDLKIQSEGLDVTPYYDLFAKPKATNAPVAATPVPPPAQPAGSSEEEPKPIDLPVKNLTASMKIDRFYLRQVVITNLHADVVIRGSEITFKTAPISLNGGPLSASAVVDVGVPGYKYDVSFDAARVPMQPLADSFSGDPPGKYSGNFSAQAKIQGAGVTGRSLQSSLQGNLNATLTNLNLQLIGPKVRPLMIPVSIVLRLPELLESPVDWVNAKAVMGEGRVDVNQFAVMSPAFLADAKGVMRIAPVLTNSPLDLPVEFSLRRSLAEKSGLLPANAPTNAAFVALPNFVKLQGTYGTPKTHIDELVISGLLLKSVGSLGPIVGDKAGNLLKGVGSLLSGQQGPPANTSTNATTNAPAANTNKLNPLDLLRFLPQKKQEQPQQQQPPPAEKK